MVSLDAIDRNIINRLQTGFPVSSRPYADAAEKLGISEGELISRIQNLLDNKILTRFGPLYRADRLGGDFSLVAIQVPSDRFDEVSDIVNSYPEVAHNYQRDNPFNMWFVLATESPERIQQVCDDIAQRTGLNVYNMPKLQEFFIELKLTV
ncbi:MAG: AsnC family transcriptional regulator [Gammaproteobacteria bacterium]|nr:AsnC family transcriptional regulator [Gammaproteobacteria bacterium]